MNEKETARPRWTDSAKEVPCTVTVVISGEGAGTLAHQFIEIVKENNCQKGSRGCNCSAVAYSVEGTKMEFSISDPDGLARSYDGRTVVFD